MGDVSTHDDNGHSAPPVTVEMCGPNLVVRSTKSIDRGFTLALVDAVNAAATANTTVIIDPEPIRCSEAFAATADSITPARGDQQDGCEPVEV
jgi:hypothetical protein